MKKFYSLVAAASVGLATFGQATVYVDIDAFGSNDGSSWSNAYVELQDAIDNAAAGDEIWIAEGTYFPTKDENGSVPAAANEKVFTWSNKDLSVLGGFDGTEAMSAERDWENNIVVFSGDIGVQGSSADNVNTILDIHGLGASPSLLDGVTLSDAIGTGGTTGAFNIYNCINFTIKNCEVSNNHNSNNGGGGSIGGSLVTIDNSVFHHNSASEGGTAYVSNSTLTVTNSVFHHNSSTQHSGNITFNGSGTAGANIFVNCLFHNNTAGSIAGGGLFFYNVAQGSKIYNCTFANNEAPNGSSIGSNGVALDIRNSIFYGLSGNTELHESNGNVSIIDIHNSLVLGGFATGTNILSSDPEFTDSANYDFTVLSSSPVIDAGDTVSISIYIPLADLNGNVRYNGSIDLGCFESEVSPMSISEMNTNSINVYPNPFKETIYFSDLGKVEVYNLQGQLVFKTINPTNHIDLPALETGTYLVQLENENGLSVQKVIKE